MGREGLWLEERVLQLQWADGGGPSKGQLGPDPHLGALDNRNCKLSTEFSKQLFVIVIDAFVP